MIVAAAHYNVGDYIVAFIVAAIILIVIYDMVVGTARGGAKLTARWKDEVERNRKHDA